MAKRVIENRVSITMPLARKRKLDAVAGIPGYGRTAGSVAASLFDAAWELFSAMEMDARRVHAFVAEHFPDAKKGEIRSNER